MFAALFIVWVPSTVNRLQSFISADSPIFGLNLASALVLPLQGFWNMMVYISTTWPECKRATREILDSIAAAKHPDKHRITTHSRKDSDHTLTARENQEFDSLQVPLTAIVKQGPEEQNQYSPA
jgi:sugar/nucleoside kinase (ribokinase family)